MWDRLGHDKFVASRQRQCLGSLALNSSGVLANQSKKHLPAFRRTIANVCCPTEKACAMGPETIRAECHPSIETSQ